MENKIDLSIVVPIYNEEKNIRPLYWALKETLDPLNKSYEIILIDDGSTDNSAHILTDLKEKDNKVVLVTLRKNFGQTAALSAGFDYARGKAIITLDSDLQNDPKDIPALLEKLNEYDLVCGWRRERKDPFLSRRFPSYLANSLISWVTGIKLHDYGCTLKAFKGEVAKNLRLYGEMHRFIPAVASWMGVSITEVPVNHHPRKFGTSKYGLSRIMRVILDLITVKFLLSFSTNPIQIFGFLGTILGGIGFLISLHLAFTKIFLGHTIGGRPLLLLGVLLLVVGLQLVILGLLAEMMVRIYHESQNKPIYVTKK